MRSLLKKLGKCCRKSGTVTGAVLDALNDYSQCVASKQHDSFFLKAIGRCH